MEQTGLELPLYNAPTADAARNVMQHAPAAGQYKSCWQKCKARLDIIGPRTVQSARRWWTGAINDETRSRVGRSRMQGALTCLGPFAYDISDTKHS